ncbi:MAG: D-alanine--D-alanine ligase [Planctomycetes bacterium]|nr:D-alanine--D-alanine ligase [Planctomycetota bacterium]
MARRASELRAVRGHGPAAGLPERHRGALRVAVLRGGSSSEREVSLESGRCVAEALGEAGHEVIPLDPAETDLSSFAWSEVGACFIALHGKFGEDGQVQELLEGLGVAYTGSGPEACRIAMSKSASKERFLLHGIPTLPYFLIHESESREEAARRAAAFGYPIVVKPDAQGSSLGVSRVSGPGELPAALAECFRWEPFGLVERCILGRELTVAVLDREPLPVLEIRPARPFYDYQAKYHDEATAYTFELGLPEGVVREVQIAAVRACEVLGTRGLCRVDFMLEQDRRPWVLEVNTIPGMTTHSLAPMAAARVGISRATLCDRLVREALGRGEKAKRAGARVVAT